MKKIILILAMLLLAGCQYHPMLVELMKPEDIAKLSTKELETLHEDQCILSNEHESKVGKELNKRYLQRDFNKLNEVKENAQDVNEFEKLSFSTDTGRITRNAYRRKWYIDHHPELSEELKKSILEGTIVLGMNKEQVIASWGKPFEINRTVSTYSNHEQWVYSHYSYLSNGLYLYFENGKLTSWQD